MKLGLGLLLLAVVLVIAVTVVLRRRARRLAARARALLDDPLEPRSTFPSVVSIPARHLRTVFAREETDPLLEGFDADRPVIVEVTDCELVVRPEQQPGVWVPLTRVRDAVFLRFFEHRRVPEGGALLRIGWERGGQALWSVFAVDGWVDAEKVRQQLHMRSSRR